ncbi:MAG TPA: hypothetical protein VGR62_10750 [Candidatus Binatia bacterium]|jgi:hypothetical protein|nr:hypothetical protein [Candidatus Binatia bacterium]
MDTKTTRTEKSASPRRRIIAVGKKQNGRWQVRTSLWRYLAATAISQ